MDRRSFLKAAGLGAAGVWISSCRHTDSRETATSRPNIILIYADDLDFDQTDVSCYPVERFPCATGQRLAGQLEPLDLPAHWDQPYFIPHNLHTPNLQRLAEEGAHFTRFHITSPMCTPSRYSLLSGRYAGRAKSVKEEYPSDGPANVAWNQRIDRDDPAALAVELGRAGYTTAMFGKWHNGQPPGTKPKEIHRRWKDDPEALKKHLVEGHRRGCEFIMEEVGFDFADRMCFGNADAVGGHNLNWYTEGVLDYLGQDHGKPFFLYFALPVPHGFGGSGEFRKNLRISPVGELDAVPDSMPPIEDAYRRLREAGASDRSITFTWIDDCLGAILDKLESRGLADNTIVIFTSDHQSRGKNACYEGTRVPFLVRWPGRIDPGKKIDDIWANIDVMPTLLEIAGRRVQNVDGESFYRRVTGAAPPRPDRLLLLEATYTKAALKGDHKYIAARPPDELKAEILSAVEDATSPRKCRYDWGGGKYRGRSRGGNRYQNNQYFPHYYDLDQLYDLRTDVFEQFNLADSRPDTLAEMKGELRDLLVDWPHAFGEFTFQSRQQGS